MTPSLRPSLLAKAYAPSAQREAIRQDGTLARIGPKADSFEPSGARASGTQQTGSQSVRATGRASALVAAKVPGGIDFTEPAGSDRTAPIDASQSGSQTVPLYRHPADRNTVATAVHAGRILDVNG